MGGEDRMRDSFTFFPSAKIMVRRRHDGAGNARRVAFRLFESHFPSSANNKSHPKGWLLLLAEDEGFEPPQTESESGVLPLH